MSWHPPRLWSKYSGDSAGVRSKVHMGEPKPSLLIVDDEKTQREGLRAALEDDYDVYLADSGAAARELLESESFDVLLTDFRMPSEDGLNLIIHAKALSKPPICILMTAYGSEEMAVEAIRRGADDYISKGKLNIDELDFRIKKAMRQHRLEKENVVLRERLDKRFGLENLIGETPAMHDVVEIIRQVAPSNSTVLITGESGTGKEMIAKAIHQLSPRARQSLVTVHCAALPATLLESELFGHERGAFTGANERRIGRVEQAEGGTLFLDEIGEIDATIQIKLLRFLGERTYERLGSNKTMRSNVRLVAATNKNLSQMVREGKFREDLFYRMNVVRVHLPTLRERAADVPLLASAFLKEFAKENAKAIRGFDPAALEAMARHPWPGNVRELRAAVEHAVVFCRRDMVGVKDLPETLRGGGGGGEGWGVPESAPEPTLSVQENKRQLTVKALQETRGNRTEAARRLGISRRTLHRLIHRFQIED